jgi:hypothetical protein
MSCKVLNSQEEKPLEIEAESEPDLQQVTINFSLFLLIIFIRQKRIQDLSVANVLICNLSPNLKAPVPNDTEINIEHFTIHNPNASVNTMLTEMEKSNTKSSIPFVSTTYKEISVLELFLFVEHVEATFREKNDGPILLFAGHGTLDEIESFSFEKLMEVAYQLRSPVVLFISCHSINTRISKLLNASQTGLSPILVGFERQIEIQEISRLPCVTALTFYASFKQRFQNGRHSYKYAYCFAHNSVKKEIQLFC